MTSKQFSILLMNLWLICMVLSEKIEASIFSLFCGMLWVLISYGVKGVEEQK